jgi:predicted RNA-binding Zn-ribbon protein involved in translation (DUF1610 family)
MTPDPSTADYDDLRIPCDVCGFERSPYWAGGPTVLDMREDTPERTDDNACPECDTGVVIEVGRQSRETGHSPIACSDNCGWTS